MFSLRTAVPDDLKRVTLLLQASYGQLMTTSYGQERIERLLSVIGEAKPELLASGTYYLAETSDRVLIGAGGWTRERPGTGEIEVERAHVRHIAAHPLIAGRGVGRAIMERVFDEAGSMGVRYLECYSSLNAVDFYARLGFKEVRPIDVPMGGDLVMSSLVMERML